MKSNSTIFQNVPSKNLPCSNQDEYATIRVKTNPSKSNTNISLSQISDSRSYESSKDMSGPKLNKLSDVLMNKLGPTYLIGYLGSAILTKGKTGLGCLQQPLRELYCMFRQNGSRLTQERRLVVSLDGLTMLFNEIGVEKFIHNDLSSVYDVQLLKLIVETRKDKKTYCAFLPTEPEPDICYTNLYHQLDKKNLKFLENDPHPPIIALIMRRPTGIQALECHVFVTRSSPDAAKIVNEIKSVCNRYKSELSQKSQVFQYKPNYETSFSSLNQEQIDQKPPINQQSTYTEIKIQNQTEKNLNQLPPKSPFNKNSTKKPTSIKKKIEKSESDIYDAYKDPKLLSKSTSNLSAKSNTSIFSRLKGNHKEKSSSTIDLNKPAKESKNKKSQKVTNLTSNSEILQSTNEASDIYEVDLKKRPSSALANLIRKEESKKQSKNLKQPSVSSLAGSDDGISSKSGPVSKKEKKLSLGKRLIMSARSSLKSNSSVGSKSLLSNSSSSINTVNSQKSTIKSKPKKDIADIDFRKTRKSILDHNLLIDSSIFGPVTVQAKPPSTPNSINLENRINLIPTPSPQTREANFILKSRSTTAPSPTQLLNPQTSSITQVNRVNLVENEIKNQNHQFQKRVFRYPVTDPKLVSNHLVWNKAKGTAESVDLKETEFYEVKNINPIAKAISPGYPTLSSDYAESVNSYRNLSTSRFKSDYIENKNLAPKVPSSLIPELSYDNVRQHELNSVSAAFGQVTNKFNGKIRDSGYNTKSSVEEEEIEKPIIYRSAFTARDKSVDLMDNFKKFSISNQMKMQQEEEEQDRKMCRINSNTHKIVGGVKVFPSLPHEFRQAAEQRQQRFQEIEKRLEGFNNNTNNSNGYERNLNDNEIIDLTQCKDLKTERYPPSSSYREIPIQITQKRNQESPSIGASYLSERNLNIKNSINHMRAKALIPANIMHGSNSYRMPEPIDRNSEANVFQADGKESFCQTDKTQKVNYIYYYDDDDHFFGY